MKLSFLWYHQAAWWFGGGWVGGFRGGIIGIIKGPVWACFPIASDNDFKNLHEQQLFLFVNIWNFCARRKGLILRP